MSNETKINSQSQQDEKMPVVGQSEQLLSFPCMDDEQQCTEQCDRCRFIENGLKSQ